MHHEMNRLFFLLLFLLPYEALSAAAAGGCKRRCGGTVVPYPFGFSAGCPIQLYCNATTSTPFLINTTAATLPIRDFNSTASTLRVPLLPLCNRTVSEAKMSLSGANYGVSSRTGLLVPGDCRSTDSNCSVPSNVISPMLRMGQCPNTTVTCITSTPPNATTAASGLGLFLQWNKVENSGCGNVLTAAMYGNTQEAMVLSLEFGVAELGWWVNGTCAGGGRSQCAVNATCHDVESPSGAWGYRCACEAGMEGDGFAAGDGCYPAAAKRSSSKSVPVIVGGVLAGVVAAAAVLLLCWVQCRRNAAGCSSSHRLAAMRLLSEAASSSGVPVYSYPEVARATNSFSHTHRLGTGAYGTVYVGKLPANSPSLVAIKRLRYRHDDDDETAVALLLNEIKLISSLSHPNLVRLLGCCLDRGEQILVYEFMPNGTLSHHLLGGGGGLPWRARLGVAAEIAASIAYLHAMRPPIFHRDVKSSNILLDGDLRPKLADFGLSRAVRFEASHVSTAPQGTPGYVDPEYHQNFHLSDKSDVYSFGVVLLELITAMKVVDFGRPASEVNLASLALDRIGKGRVNEIVDPALVDHGEEWVMESVQQVSELAFRCLAFQKDVRPCMSEVAAELRLIRDAAPASRPEPMSRLGPMIGLEIDVGFDGPVMAVKKAGSPVSVQETWVSDRSSPSTNGSMPRFM